MIFLPMLLARAAAFSPWARNDTNAYIFTDHLNGVLEKRRRRLDSLRRKGGDTIIRDAVGRGLDWNALGVAFPRDSRDEAFVKFAQTVVAHQPVDRAMLRHDAMRSERRRLAAHDAGRLDATGAAIIDDWGLSFENVTRISLKAHAALGREVAARRQNVTPRRRRGDAAPRRRRGLAGVAAAPGGPRRLPRGRGLRTHENRGAAPDEPA